MSRALTALYRSAKALVALAALALPGGALATTYHYRTPEQLALAADLIFVATVEEQTVLEEAGEPWTEVTFAVERWLADGAGPVDPDGGSLLPATVSLRFLGGTLPGGRMLTVSGVPQLRARERVLVFAYEAGGLASPVVGVSQGIWTLDARGARSSSGRYLVAGEAGRLTEAATGSGLDDLAAALLELLAAGGPPDSEEPAEPPPAEAPAEEAGAPGSDDPEAATETDATGAAGSDPTGDEASVGSAPPAQPEDGQAAGEPDEQPAEAPGQAAGPEPLLVHYTVNESGGPLLLSDAVQRAAAAWAEAAPAAVEFTAADASEDGPGAVHTVLYGAPELFGPDALSLTLVRGGGAPIEVRASPRASALLEAALVHELGVLAGLAEEGSGVMARALDGTVLAPTAADVLLLQELRTYRPEDLNRDGVVDFYDLAELAQTFGASGVNLTADLNGDGVVNEADLALLESVYQFLPPSEQPPADR